MTARAYPAGLSRLLGEIETGDSVADQLARAASQLAAMHTEGELAALPDHTRTEMAALALALLGWADRVRDMETAEASRPRAGRISPLPGSGPDPDVLAMLREQGMTLTDAEAELVARWCGVRS